jgi:hypothetical protein
MSNFKEHFRTPCTTGLKNVNEEFETEEFRMQQAKKLTRFLSSAEHISALKGKKVEEVFSTEKKIREFLLELSSEEYVQLLEGINGIFRNKDSDNWIADGQKVEIGSWTFPKQEDKVDLLARSLAAAKTMANDGRNITEIAFLLSTVITGVHLFENGNGRTSRAVFFLTNKGFTVDNKDDFEKLMASDGISGLSNPKKFYGLIKSKMCKEVGVNWQDLHFDNRALDLMKAKNLEPLLHQLSPEYKSHFLAYFEDKHPLYVTLALVLLKKEQMELLKSADGSINMASLFGFIEEKDVKIFSGLLDEIKKKYVSSIIDCFLFPDKEENRVSLRDIHGSEQSYSIVDICKNFNSLEDGIKEKVF